MKKRFRIGLYILSLAMAAYVVLAPHAVQPITSMEPQPQISDHFDGEKFFNPGAVQQISSPMSPHAKRSGFHWLMGWLFGNGWPEWTSADVQWKATPMAYGDGDHEIRITPIGHSTFLIQMDGMNILTDPIWSERCSPVTWVGPKRYRTPGVRFEDLPTIDAVLVSHNHYDHLDVPTLERLADRGTSRAVVPLGNGELVQEAGIDSVDSLDWWQSVPLSPTVTVTLVPAQHFSSRTLWDRNKTLWGGFIVSGPSGQVFYAGDTGYGPHFKEIAKRFPSIKVALLPIAPFRPGNADDPAGPFRNLIHMGPGEAVQAHMDLQAAKSIAAHFSVFQLGPDGMDDAAIELAAALKKNHLEQDAFVTPFPVGTAHAKPEAKNARTSAAMPQGHVLVPAGT